MKCLTCQHAARVIRLRSLQLCFLLIAGLSASSCDILKSTDSQCGEERQSRLELETAGQALTSASLETTLVGGRRTFSWSLLVENACSEEHAVAYFHLLARVANIPPGWQVDAGYLTAALVGSDVSLYVYNLEEGREYTNTVEVGLSQAFDGQPGRYLMFLEISFTSQGNLQVDQEVAQRVITRVRLIGTYKLHKAN